MLFKAVHSRPSQQWPYTVARYFFYGSLWPEQSVNITSLFPSSLSWSPPNYLLIAQQIYYAIRLSWSYTVCYMPNSHHKIMFLSRFIESRFEHNRCAVERNGGKHWQHWLQDGSRGREKEKTWCDGSCLHICSMLSCCGTDYPSWSYIMLCRRQYGIYMISKSFFFFFNIANIAM